MTLKKSIGNVFDIFSDGTCWNKIQLSCILENARTSLEHCQLIVTENRCFDTAQRIQIMKMNICKRDLNIYTLKSTCYYKYLINLL